MRPSFVEVKHVQQSLSMAEFPKITPADETNKHVAENLNVASTIEESTASHVNEPKAVRLEEVSPVTTDPTFQAIVAGDLPAFRRYFFVQTNSVLFVI